MRRKFLVRKPERKASLGQHSHRQKDNTEGDKAINVWNELICKKIHDQLSNY
jgi:hypothetical protein